MFKSFVFVAIVSLAAAFCQGCSTQQPSDQQIDTFECSNGRSFKVSYSDFRDEVRIAMNQCTIRLPRTPSASGESYSNGQVTFWSQGLDGKLIMPKGAYRHCQRVASSRF